MKQQLYSELRTIYGTTEADPHTFRLTLKLKDLADGAVLRPGHMLRQNGIGYDVLNVAQVRYPRMEPPA